jgi:hypothetical protein
MIAVYSVETVNNIMNHSRMQTYLIEVNEGYLGNVRWEYSRHFRNKKREYLKDKKKKRLNQTVRIRTSETCIGA